MSIWSRVLCGLIIVATFPLVYLASRNLAANHAWSQRVAKLDADLAKTTAEADVLRRGEASQSMTAPDFERGRPYDPSQGQIGIAQLDVSLHDLLAGRGAVWFNCRRGQVAAPTGELSVFIDEPTPHQIKDRMVLYLFEEDERGKYLGEYKVTGVADDQITLQATVALTPRQQQNLANCRDPLVLYETMPADRHRPFAGLTEDELRAMLPAPTVQEYVKHGQPAEAGESDQRVADGLYVRRLRDYSYLIREAQFGLARQTDQIAALTNQAALMEATLKSLRNDDPGVEDEIDRRDKQIASLEQLLATAKTERDQVQAHLEAVSQRLDELKARFEQLQTEKRQLAAQIAAAATLLPQASAQPGGSVRVSAAR